MKNLVWYLAWFFSAVSLVILVIAAITSLAGTEFLGVKWTTLWWADGNFILISILAVILHGQLRSTAKEEK